MSITILTIGKVKNSSLQKEILDLSKRISRFKLIELKEIKEKNIDVLKKKEFELIKPYIKNNVKTFLLWEYGDEFTTKEFYDFCFKKISGDILFIITGAYGPNDELKSIVDYKISLSKMTYTHEQALYMLVEQLYRVECINKNIPYNK